MSKDTKIKEKLREVCTGGHDMKPVREFIEEFYIEKQKVREAIDEKIKYWENFIKKNKLKKGAIRFVRIRIIIEEFNDFKKQLKLEEENDE